MLAYHPAFDPYHCLLRTLRILAARRDSQYEADKLRILDFYYLFPELIRDIRLPPTLRSTKNAVSPKPNKYIFSGSPKLVFKTMEGLQLTAQRLLLSKGLLNKESFLRGYIALGERPLPELLDQLTTDESHGALLRFLVHELAAFPLTGADGLKDRSRLMEFKYDAA